MPRVLNRSRMVVGCGGCPAASSGEQPPAARIGRSGQVRPGRQVLTDDRIERRRDGCWRVAQPNQHLAVVNGDVVDGQSGDLG